MRTSLRSNFLLSWNILCLSLFSSWSSAGASDLKLGDEILLIDALRGSQGIRLALGENSLDFFGKKQLGDVGPIPMDFKIVWPAVQSGDKKITCYASLSWDARMTGISDKSYKGEKNRCRIFKSHQDPYWNYYTANLQFVNGALNISGFWELKPSFHRECLNERLGREPGEEVCLEWSEIKITSSSASIHLALPENPDFGMMEFLCTSFAPGARPDLSLTLEEFHLATSGMFQLVN